MSTASIHHQNKTARKTDITPQPHAAQHRDLISELHNGYRDWFLDAGTEMEMKAGETVIKEGLTAEAFYFLIEGLLKVHHTDQPDKNIAMVAPGQLIGEMSFIEKVPASVSVSVVERAMLLEIPFAKVEEKMEADVQFRATFQKALLGVLSSRLRATSGKLKSYLESEIIFDKKENASLFKAVDDFKHSMFTANECEIKKENAVFQQNAFKVVESLGTLVHEMDKTIGDYAPGKPHEKDVIGYKIQQELTPYVLMSNILKRSYTKPRGYAGDYLTIAQMYDNKPIGNGKTGELLDRITLQNAACTAVKNRRGLLAKEIFKTVNENNGSPTHITSFASGPAQELFDVYEHIDNPESLKSHLIDIDLKALAFVSDKIENSSQKIKMDLHQANLIYLALGRRQLPLPPQDLVYSIGLIDYFNDQLVIKLINYAYKLLKPGGRIILGNFHTGNKLKAFMDYVLDWRLIHRSEDDMNRLFESSDFGKPCTDIQYEEQGINLFASCMK